MRRRARRGAAKKMGPHGVRAQQLRLVQFSSVLAVAVTVAVAVAVVVMVMTLIVILPGGPQRNREAADRTGQYRIELEPAFDQLDDRCRVVVFMRDAGAVEALRNQQCRDAGARAPLVGGL